uniref:Uncharacterized protein n=1 Tax=Arundo donax TaxID=35708 RepID=A0A0A9ECD4_ARUDO
MQRKSSSGPSFAGRRGDDADGSSRSLCGWFQFTR